MKYVTNNVEGFVPLGVIASFRKMKKLTRDMSFIVSALKESDLRRVFGEAGNIKRITVRDPHDAKDPKKCTDAEKLINGKMHAFIYEDSCTCGVRQFGGCGESCGNFKQ
ncbi:hypothetical protein ABFS82_08G091700 [Erythranthe guttata]